MSNQPILLTDDFFLPRNDVDVNTVSGFSHEDQFMSLSVELLKEVGAITVVLSSTYHLDESQKPRKWNRNEAILSGLLTRVCKLHLGFLDQVCQDRGELANLIFRPLAETIINLGFLLINRPEMFDEYVEYSLREEKRLLIEIEQAVGERGYELPIETRMKSSILKSFEKSELKPDQVNEKNYKSWGGSIYARAKSFGMPPAAYIGLMGLPSHTVHGNWQDLISNHLEFDGELFMPNTDWSPYRPQPVIAAALLTVRINLKYLEKVIPDSPTKVAIRLRLKDLNLRLNVIDELHEQFIQKSKS